MKKKELKKKKLLLLLLLLLLLIVWKLLSNLIIKMSLIRKKPTLKFPKNTTGHSKRHKQSAERHS